MKHKKTFIVILAAVIFLAGCSNGTTDPGLSKTTRIDKIELSGRFYTPEQQESLHDWEGGWEFSPQESRLKLSNLMPTNEIKNNTNYEVTVSGTSDTPMNGFQFEFTVPGNHILEGWLDLSDVPDPMTIQEGTFSKTIILKTHAEPVVTSGSGTDEDPLIETHVNGFYNSGMLAFTNAIDTTAAQHNVIMATLTDVTITITEK